MTNTKQETTLFDPGYAKHTTILSISSELIYRQIEAIKNFGQKKIKFKMLYPQLTKMADNNVGFCLGCILWAVYIKTLGDIKIEGNPCLGDTYNEDEAVEEIDFSINFYDKLKKDAKYYLNTEYNINPIHIKILNLYREFLTLNASFVNTKTTNDIILPKELKTPTPDEIRKIYEKIEQVIKTGNLLELLEVSEFIYE